MNPVRLLFVSLGTNAFGECIIARLFAKRLPRDKFESFFLIAPQHKVLFQSDPQFHNVVLVEGRRKLNEILIDDMIHRNKIDLIILSDYLTYSYSTLDFGMDIDDLRQFNKPIISFDCYEWAATDYTLDFLDNRDRQLKIRFSDIDGSLRPCPLNKPYSSDPQVLCYDFLGSIPTPADLSLLSSIKLRLDIKHDQYTVVSPIADWERVQVEKQGRTAIHDLVENLMFESLESLQLPVNWVRVGSVAQHKIEQRGLVTVTDVPAIAPQEFDCLVAGSEGYITTNISGTSLAKRVLWGGSAVLFWNGFDVSCETDLDSLGFAINNSMRCRLNDCYPIRSFSMFPLGWGQFLRYVLKDNPYLSTFSQAQIFNSDSVRKTVRNMLVGCDPETIKNIATYKEMIESLPLPEDCVLHFFKNSKL